MTQSKDSYAGSGFVDFLLGKSRLLTGLEDTPEGLKICLGPRYENDWYVVTDPNDAKELRRAWANPTQKVFVSGIQVRHA